MVLIPFSDLGTRIEDCEQQRLDVGAVVDRQVGPYFAALCKETVAATATRLEERSPRIRVSGALTDPGGPLADLALEFGTRGLAGLRPNDFGQRLQ